MRTIILKLLCWFCVTVTTTSLAYQNTNINSKTAYIDAQWRNKFNTKDNRYAMLLKSSTHAPSTINLQNDINRKYSHRSKYNYIDENANPIKFRHSRYPSLGGVLTRLDNMKTSTTTFPPFSHQRRYDNLEDSDNLLEVNYNEDELEEEDVNEKENDDMPDYEEWEMDENDKNDENDNVNDEDEYDWQAEEATEAPTSYLTQYKWQHYGTRTRVEESRRNQNYPDHSKIAFEMSAAHRHILKMDREARCKKPMPKVLSVQSVHPDPGKSYTPRCTVLHRCAEDTGCCSNHDTRCGPKRQTLVSLYFFATTVLHPDMKVEKLEFYNHTECGCINKSSQPLQAIDDSESDLNIEVSRPYRSSLSTRDSDSSFSLYPQTLRRCKCPEQYISRFDRNYRCTCDCPEGNLDCVSMKKGDEHFSLKDRLCILDKKCGTPSCEYGLYLKNIGRCPKIEEKFGAFASMSADLD